MRKLILSLFIFITPGALVAQEITESMEESQFTMVGENYLLTGFKPYSKMQDFIAVLYDHNLKELSRYKKNIGEGIKSAFVSVIGKNYLFTFYGPNNKTRYRIALDEHFTELLATPVTKADEVEDDDNTIHGADWTYDFGYCNYYFYGDILLDAQSRTLSCYSVSDNKKGDYTLKWRKDFAEKQYLRFQLLGINGQIAYYLAVQRIPRFDQALIAVNLETGVFLFNSELNTSDSLDALVISNMYIKGQTMFAAGTFVRHEPNEPFRVLEIPDDTYIGRGYENRADYFMAGADGYFILTLDANTGIVNKMKTFDFPSVDKTVDNRMFRMAVCQGLQPLDGNKFVAFFEQISTSKTGVGLSGFNTSRDLMLDDEGPASVKWETDAFTSVVFSEDLSSATSNTFIWNEDATDHTISEFDLFSLIPRSIQPHDFCTLDDDGFFIENFTCDGTKWTFHMNSDDDKVNDFLILCSETDMHSLKLLPPGLSVLTDPTKGVQVKDMGAAVKVKLYTVN